jgi:monoamine oxidase
MGTKQDTTYPSRRDVIAGAGAVGITSGIDASIGSAEAQGRRKHVIIVGAGLAGLCAAYRLQQKGWTYTILEAERQHVGGRIRTMQMGNGLHWEAGAMRIPKDHDLTLKYVDEFSELERQPFVMASSRTFKAARGVKSTDEAVIKKQFRLKAAETDLSSADFWALGVKNIAEGKPNDGHPPALTADDLIQLGTANVFGSEALIQLDRQSLRQLMQKATLKDALLSDEAIDFTLFAYGNLAIQHGASTEFLREENIGIWDREFFQIKGGTSRLPGAFLSRLNTKPMMGCEVVWLEQTRDKVIAHYRSVAGEGKQEGDFLICTIPFPVLASVKADPPFSDEKRRAILEMGYDSGTKVAVMTKERFWEKNDGIYGGSTTTDLMSGAIVYPSDNALNKDGEKPLDAAVSDRPGIFLASYCWGQDARRLGALPPSEREATVIRMVSDIHPELREPGMIIKTMSWAWDTYRWCGGAFAFYQPGQFQRMHEHVIKPEGRIYFAGEHCSHSHSWMQGALESAENAIDLLTRAG